MQQVPMRTASVASGLPGWPQEDEAPQAFAHREVDVVCAVASRRRRDNDVAQTVPELEGLPRLKALRYFQRPDSGTAPAAPTTTVIAPADTACAAYINPNTHSRL